MTERLAHAPGAAPVRGPRALIFEVGAPESRCVEAPPLDVPMGSVDDLLGGRARTEPLVLPNVTELEIMRHYAHLASMNFGVDSGMYPLGSCTMKYNPRINEDACRLPGFAGIHPYQPEGSVQGALELMVGLSDVARRDLGTARCHAAARRRRPRRADGAHGVPRGAHGARGRSQEGHHPGHRARHESRQRDDVRLGDRHDSQQRARGGRPRGAQGGA